MMIEAVRKDLVKPPNILKKLKKFPERIKQLNEYFINTLKIPEMSIQEEGIKVIATNDDEFSRVKSLQVHKPTDVKMS